jgi:hypothetical protein
MAPNLSLIYNSQSGNGIAGQGWELGGLSMIHRCPKTRAQDGYAQPVQIQASDGLCLDGQRLSEDGTGGYYLESEQFSSIRPIMNTSLPSTLPIAGFEVVTKSGETRIYGKRDDARVRVVYVPPATRTGGNARLAPLTGYGRLGQLLRSALQTTDHGHESGSAASWKTE